MNNSELINKAIAAMDNSYSPYSGFSVGAALLGKSGKVYTGCNIENSAFSPTNCAERTAVFKAVSEGEREFVKIAIVGGHGAKITNRVLPCGVCRQVLSEFCDKDFEIICFCDGGEQVYTLGELLPESFSLEEKNEL